MEVERKQREEETRKLEAKNRAQLAEIQQKQNEERIALQKEKVRCHDGLYVSHITLDNTESTKCGHYGSVRVLPTLLQHLQRTP